MIHTLNYLELKQISIILGYVFEADPYAKFQINKLIFSRSLLILLQPIYIFIRFTNNKDCFSMRSRHSYMDHRGTSRV